MKAFQTKFTLVELLVTIAVIGILGALLLPALQSSLKKARLVPCKNNMRHLHFALFSYAGDNQEFFPVEFPSGLPGIFKHSIMKPYGVRLYANDNDFRKDFTNICPMNKKWPCQGTYGYSAGAEGGVCGFAGSPLPAIPGNSGGGAIWTPMSLKSVTNPATLLFLCQVPTNRAGDIAHGNFYYYNDAKTLVSSMKGEGGTRDTSLHGMQRFPAINVSGAALTLPAFQRFNKDWSPK